MSDCISLMKETLFACLAEGTHDRSYGGVLTAGGKKAWVRFSVVDAETSSALASGRPNPDQTAGARSGEDTSRVDEIVTALYHLFKNWSRRGFGPDDVTWCEVRAAIVRLVSLSTHERIHTGQDVWSFEMADAPRDGTSLLCVEYDEPEKVVDLHWFSDGGAASAWRGSFGQLRRPIAWRYPPAPPVRDVQP